MSFSDPKRDQPLNWRLRLWRLRLAQGKFDLDDFRRQIGYLLETGSAADLLRQLPGLAAGSTEPVGSDVIAEIKHIQGIIDSMTPAERRDPKTITPTRRKRIALGAGVDLGDVASLLEQFAKMAELVRVLSERNVAGTATRLTGRKPARLSGPLSRYNWLAMWEIQRKNILLWDFLADPSEDKDT